MNIYFATCNRQTALGYLKTVYPSVEVTDTPESAGPTLDLVAADIIRIEDPMMYGNRIQVLPGTHWDDSRRSEITATVSAMHDLYMAKVPA